MKAIHAGYLQLNHGLRHTGLILSFRIANMKPVNTAIRSFSFGYLKHIIRMTKSKTMRWARNVTGMGGADSSGSGYGPVAGCFWFRKICYLA
jgi:hypothetical protein